MKSWHCAHTLWMIHRLKDFISTNLIPRMQVVALRIVHSSEDFVTSHFKPQHRLDALRLIVDCTKKLITFHLELRPQCI